MPALEQSPPRVPPRRLLLLEDEWLIAIDLQDMLEAAGYIIIGPASSVGAALDLIKAASEPIGVGLLDVHVGKELSYPVATEMRRRGTPFAFLTGHTREDLEPEFRSQPMISKPTTAAQLLRRLNELLA